MPFLSETLLATKVIKVMQSQDVLQRMREEKDSVQQVTIDKLGQVVVTWQDGSRAKVGVLRLDYFKQFGRMLVRSWDVTGGRAMEEYTRRTVEGTITPMQFFGLNLHIEITPG